MAARSLGPLSPHNGGFDIRLSTNEPSTPKSATSPTTVLKSPNRFSSIFSRAAKKVENVGNEISSKITSVIESLNSNKENDPEPFITKTGLLIQSQNPDFYFFCKFLTNRITDLYVKNESFIIEEIKKVAPSTVKDSLAEALIKKQKLILCTLEANILNFFLNILNKTNENQERLLTINENPFVKFIALFGDCFNRHLDIIDSIEETPENKARKVKAIQKLSEELLSLGFPKGKKELQFYLDLPFTSALRQFLWKFIKKKFSKLVFTLYFQSKPIFKENENIGWKADLDSFSGISNTYGMFDSTSLLVQEWFLKSTSIIFLKKSLDKYLEPIPVLNKERVSQISVGYLQGVITTSNPSTLKVGNFLKNFFLKQVLRKFAKEKTLSGEKGFFDSFLKYNVTVINKFSNCDLTTLSPLITKSLLEWFGFKNKDDLPIPKVILGKIELKIIEIQNTRLPIIFKEQMSPIWPLFVNKEGIKEELNDLLNDNSIVRIVEFFSQHFIDQGILFFKNQRNLLIGANPLFPLSFLNEIHKNQIQEQVKAFLFEESSSISLLKNLVKTYVEGIIFSLLAKQYKVFLKNETNKAHFKDSPNAFNFWFLKKITEVLNPISLESLEPHEHKKLKRIFVLKKEIQKIEDGKQKEEKIKNLEILFQDFKPKFKQVLLGVLSLVGISNSKDLPLPAAFQDPLWSLIEENAPYFIFYQMSEILEPIYEKDDLKKKIGTLPHGELLIEGCHYIVRDLIAFLPDWFDNYINIARDLNKDFLFNSLDSLELTEMAKDLEKMTEDDDVKKKHLLTILKKYGYSNFSSNQSDKIEEIKKYKERLEAIVESPRKLLETQQFLELSPKFKELLIFAIESFIKNEKDDFKGPIEFFESLILSQLYKVILKLSKLPSDLIESELSRLKVLVENLKNETPEQVNPRIEKYIEQLFKQIGLKHPRSLYGIPLVLKNRIFALIKKIIIPLIYCFYRNAHTIHTKHEDNSLFKRTVNIQNVLETLRNGIDFGIQTGLDKIREPSQETLKGIHILYRFGNNILGAYEKQNVKTAAFVKKIFESGEITSSLEKIIYRLTEKHSRQPILALVQELKPQISVIIDQFMSALLQKEQEKGKIINEALIESFLELFTKHLQHLNQAASKNEKVTIRSFAAVSGKDLHHAINLSDNEEENLNFKKDHFYQPLSKDLMKFIFPGGKKDLKIYFPELPASSRLFIWRAIKNSIANGLLIGIETLFEEETLIEILTESFEKAATFLDSPINLKEELNPKVSTDNQSENNKKLEILTENFLREGATFLNLSIDKIDAWPKWKKRIFAWDKVKSSCVKTIAATIKEKFNGKFFSNTLKEVFSKPIEIKYFSKTFEEKKALSKETVKKFSKLQHKIAVSSLLFATRMIKEKLNFYICSIKNKPLQILFRCFINILSLIITKLLWPICKIFKIDKRLQNRIHLMIGLLNKRIVDRFKNPNIQENFIFQFSDSFKKILKKA